MAQGLFVTTKDIATFTSLNGNVDNDKFVQFIKIAQDIHIQNYLGTDLYDKISEDIVNSTLTGDYLSLVNTYVKPMVIHWAMVEYLPFSAYKVANQGVYKHLSETAESVDKTEVDFLIGKETQIAEHYTERFVQYICNNSELFPEYNSNSNGDMYPDQDVNFTNWFL